MIQTFLAYLADLRDDAGAKLWLAIALVAGGAVLEGIGLLSILPFAAVITGDADTQLAAKSLAALDAVGLSTSLQRAIALIVGFIVLLVMRGVVTWKRDVTLHEMGLGYVDRWRSRLFAAIGKADWLTIARLRRTDIEHMITNDVARLSSGTDRLLRTGASAAIAVVQLGIIALLSPKLLGLVCALFAITLFLTMPLLRKSQKLGQRITQSGRRIHGVLGDFMSSQKLARLNNAEDGFHDRFERTIADVRSHQTAFHSSQARARAWFQIAAGVVVAAALLIGTFVLDTPLSVMVVTLAVLARLVGPVQTIAQTGQAMAHSLPAYDALTAVYAQLCAARQAADGQPQTGSDRAAGPAALAVHDVSFRYSSQSEPVLVGASLSIGAGEIVGLKGGSGAGKTTLLDIIAGLLPTARGTITVDGHRLQDADDCRAWREQVAYLPQDPFLFDATLRENLLWSARARDDAAIADALEAADAAAFIARLPDGLDTIAGDRGLALSGGERQRLCLARALLRQPRLLILDEATNALDAQREDRILTTLSQMTDRFSILLVSHRKETMQHAHHVFELSGGTTQRVTPVDGGIRRCV